MAQSNNDKRVELLNDFRSVLKTKFGRQVLVWLLVESNLLQRSYVAHNQFDTAFNEGLRSLGVRLKEYIEAAEPGEFARLLLENMEKGEDNGRNRQPDAPAG